MAAQKKYFKSRAEARRVCAERNAKLNTNMYGVWKMPKGTRHVGMYAVCTDIIFLNSD